MIWCDATTAVRVRGGGRRAIWR